MKPMLYMTAAVLVSFAMSGPGQQAKEPAHGSKTDTSEAVFKNYNDLKWEKILPDLAENSPEICILHVDPKTKATK